MRWDTTLAANRSRAVQFGGSDLKEEISSKWRTTQGTALDNRDAIRGAPPPPFGGCGDGAS
jgi:hypothetical protein